MIAAILRAQILSMRFRRGGQLGATVFGVIAGLFFYGFWTFLAGTAALFFSLPDQRVIFIPALSGVLLFVMAYWQLAPIVSASFGASLDLQKLLAYPIPHNKLFLVEILLRLTTCLEMLLIIAGATIGLLLNPTYRSPDFPGIIGGAILFAGMNLLLSAGTRNWLERLFRNARLKEVMGFVVVIVSVLPRLLLMRHVKGTAVMQFVPSQLWWPWAAFSRLMLGNSKALAILFSVLWLGAVALFSRGQFERSIRFDGASARKPRTEFKADSLSDRLFRIPSRLLPDPIAVMVEKELRTFARTPRFRLVYVMSACFGVVLYLPSLHRGGSGDTFFGRNALPFMALYGLLMLGQISYWNAFGLDRAAVQGYFSWPVRFRDALIAKNVSVLFVLVPQVLAISLVCKAVGMSFGPGKIIETVIVMAIACLYWFALGNISSVRAPRAIDTQKMNQMGGKIQALTLFAAPFVLLPLALAYWSRWFFESELAFAGIVLIAAIIGAIFYGVGLDSAVNTASLRRENMLRELSRTEGPLSVT